MTARETSVDDLCLEKWLRGRKHVGYYMREHRVKKHTLDLNMKT